MGRLKQFYSYLLDPNKKADFYDVLFQLKIMGFSPLSHKNRWNLRLFSLAIHLPFMVLVSADVIDRGSLEGLLDQFQMFVQEFQLLMKLMILTYFEKTIMDIVECTNNFWTFDVASSPERRAYAQQPHRVMKILLTSYRVLVLFTACCFVLLPIPISGKAGVRLFRQTKDGSAPYYYWQFLTVFPFTYVNSNLLISFEGLFFYMVGHLASEMRLIRMAFEDLLKDDKLSMVEQKRRLNEIIRHHHAALWMIEQMRQMYSLCLLTLYSITFIIVSSVTFLLILQGFPPKMDTFTQYTTYMFLFVVQIWIYCFFGDILKEECKIADDVFYNGWDRFIYEHKYDIAIILCRAQKEEALTIGGFIDLNLPAFTTVIRSSASFVAFMDTIYNS